MIRCEGCTPNRCNFKTVRVEIRRPYNTESALNKIENFPKIGKVLNFESAQNRPLPHPDAQEEGGRRAVGRGGRLDSLISQLQ